MLVTASPPAPLADDTRPSFETFFRQHYARVFALLYRVAGNSEDADDLAQEVFLQLYRRDPPIWESEAADSWLWRAASHAALNALRTERRRRDREERAYQQENALRPVAERAEDPADALARRAQQAGVRSALRQLKPQESALLLLRHAGLSYAEVAQALDLNPASVGTLIRRAAARFKEKYHG